MVDFSDKQLDAEDTLPENWRTSMNHSDELYHFSVKGMKWGVRKKSKISTDTLRKNASVSKLRSDRATSNFVNKDGRVRSRAAMAGNRIADSVLIGLGHAAVNSILDRTGGFRWIGLSNTIALGMQSANLGLRIADQVAYRSLLSSNQKSKKG